MSQAARANRSYRGSRPAVDAGGGRLERSGQEASLHFLRRGFWQLVHHLHVVGHVRPLQKTAATLEQARCVKRIGVSDDDRHDEVTLARSSATRRDAIDMRV